MNVHSVGVGFNDSEYIIREGRTNHTVPVSVTGGRLPTDTAIQVIPDANTTEAGIILSNWALNNGICIHLYVIVRYVESNCCSYVCIYVMHP